ncbi:MAG: nicotinate phosphoribosyltransferase [Nitrososphaerota archaeon]|nr:nicotinate phosphoribosyltransferase [Nitrososphaerota archaeon]MDG6966114.1 nicotinate phosphoribosyltransferase [Nitrososphaerota archaeon]MDG6977549.1 nicotinate phosphoribosyltransferase [Nitrososphaerota archaeon]MDG7020787.1 nicotinate phosphoribosyltransferase [Nitrososphaerota archaeon]
MANENEIKRAKTTDIYFLNTKEILTRHHIDSEVVMEVFARDLPDNSIWGVLSGVYEVAKLLEGVPVDVWALDEGSIFLADARTSLYEPVLTISGRYRDFVEYENPVLGLLSTSSSISTKASRFRVAAGDRQVISFGTRRVHPALAPLIERGCYIAGFDGVSNVLGGKLLGVEPLGTMPHALVQVIGDQVKAWTLYDETIPKRVKRTVLVDTFWDEKTEAIKAFETLGKNLSGVRLDTPASRRGNFREIIEEVKWELKIRGGEAVKIFVSGRLSEEDVVRLRDIVDGFGVGTAVAYPPSIDFAAKIVEVREGGTTHFRAKRGGLGGRKDVHRSRGFKDTVTLHGAAAPVGSKPILKQIVSKGEVTTEFRSIESIRQRLSRDLAEVSRAEPALIWG